MKEENKIWLEKYILNNPFDFKNRIINHCRGMDKLDVYEWIAEDELKINNLQSQLKAKEEVIKEAREVISKMIYTGYLVENGATAIQYMPTGKKTEFYPRAKIIDEILSKGENK